MKLEQRLVLVIPILAISCSEEHAQGNWLILMPMSSIRHYTEFIVNIAFKHINDYPNVFVLMVFNQVSYANEVKLKVLGFSNKISYSFFTCINSSWFRLEFPSGIYYSSRVTCILLILMNILF